MRRVSLAMCLFALTPLVGCGAGDNEFYVEVRINNYSDYCGPGFANFGEPLDPGAPCNLEFENSSAELVDPDTGSTVARSSIFRPGNGVPGVWTAEILATVPADQDYEVRIPGCEEIGLVSNAPSSEEPPLSISQDANFKTFETQVMEDGRCREF